MQYLLTPLYTHIDFEFGRTDDVFRAAADKLEEEDSYRRGIGHEQLPINYLRRHALELYLKSAIVIIHGRLGLPYGEMRATGEPFAFVRDKWRPIQGVHSVRDLWNYLARLFQDEKVFFDSVSRVDWSFPSELDGWIEEIERLDPRSTFFRYPNPRTPSDDRPKAAMASGSPLEIAKRVKQSSDQGPKQFIVLMDNDDGEVVKSYYYAGEPLAHFARTPKAAVEMFHGLHAATRAEVCGGS